MARLPVTSSPASHRWLEGPLLTRRLDRKSRRNSVFSTLKDRASWVDRRIERINPTLEVLVRSEPPAPHRLPTKPTPERAAPGSRTAQVDNPALADGAELQQKLLAIFRSPQYKPPVLPNIALELSDLSRKPNVSYDDVVRVVEKDPLIVASMLKLAQSPMYGGRLPLQSLRDALNRLGINTLRDMVWQIVTGMRLFRVGGYKALERLQRHATFAAHTARIVAQHSDVTPELAFLCGLMHDIGWSGTLIAVSESEKNPRRDPTLLLAAIDTMHAEAGSAMAKLWGLSPEIVAVIGHHHDLSPERPPVSLLVPVLCIAERLSDEFGFGFESATEARPESTERLDANLPGRYEHALGMLRLEPKMDRVRELVEQVAMRIDGGDFDG